MHTLLITSMGGAGSRNIVDTLRMHGVGDDYRIIGTHFDPMELLKSDLEDLFVVPRARDAEAYIEAHLKLFDRFGVDALIANSDFEVEVFSRFADRIPCRHLLPPAQQVDAVQDKFVFYNILHGHGCPTVVNAELTALSDLPQAIDKVMTGDRFWIRLRKGSGSVGATWLQNAQQAEKWIDLWCDLRGFKVTDFVLAPFLPGRDFCVSVLYQANEFVVGTVYERLSYWHSEVSMSGMGSTPLNARTIGDTLPIDRACQAVEAICREFDLPAHGLYNVDLKCDEDGTPYVTEINIGRFFMTSSHHDRTGKHSVTELYLALLLDPDSDLPRGVYDTDPGKLILRGPDMQVKIVDESALEEMKARAI